MDIFSYIKSKLPILDVIQEYTTLKPIGHYWKGLCPFHSEKTGSFTVSPNKDIFYCFGCQESGDVISFISKIESLTQIEAAKTIIEKYNINVPDEILSESKNKASFSEKKDYAKICEFVAQWCNEKLKKNNDAYNYVQSRNLSNSTIKKFCIGYFPEKKELKNLIKDASKNNILAQDLIDANIILDRSGDLYSPYEDRIIFPIKNPQGDYCGFGGRVFKKNDDRAKYYNSKENPFFSKGHILYGFDLAKKEIQKTEEVYLVEGYTDCVAMVEHGIKNTVATLGTACTTDHLKLISRFATKIHLLFDGDEAGKKAALRLTEIAWDANLEIDVITLPDGEDPASYLNQNRNKSNFLESKIGIFNFLINSNKNDFTNLSLSEKLNASRKIIEIINKLNDPIKRGILFQTISRELDIPINAIKQRDNFQFSNIENSKKENSIEIKILGAILHDKNLENKFKSIINFLPDDLKEIIEVNKEVKNFDELLNHLEPENKKMAIKAYFDLKLENINAEAMLSNFQKKNWKKINNALKNKIAIAQKNGNNRELIEYLTQLNNWKKKFISEE